MHEGARGGIRTVDAIEALMAATPRYEGMEELALASISQAVSAEDAI